METNLMDKTLDRLIISKTEKSNDTIYLTATGRIGLSESTLLDNELELSLKKSPKKVILNMKNIVFLSSIGIRVILAFYKRTLNKNIVFKIEAPSEQVINVLGLTNLDELLLK